jgi:hypothetical protein
MKRLWKNVLLGTVLVGAPALAYVGCKASRAGYQSAGYTVRSTDGAFEIRDYETLALVSAPMTSSGDRGMNRGFNQLFQYITGKNEGDTKIAMTTPVFINPEEGNTDNPTMSFVIPREIAQAGAPTPADASVTLDTMAGGPFATYRFQGNRTPESERAALDKLRSWMMENDLEGTSSPQFAYYDPPWTPSFLRRNEVLIRLADN